MKQFPKKVDYKSVYHIREVNLIDIDSFLLQIVHYPSAELQTTKQFTLTTSKHSIKFTYIPVTNQIAGFVGYFSITATFLCPQGGSCYGEVRLCTNLNVLYLFTSCNSPLATP